jgi:ATP-dependent phosphoenolpyruvate carboxykinase
MSRFTLQEHELTVGEIHRNLAPSALYEHAIRYDKGTSIAENGALVAYSGVKTGRSPKDIRENIYGRHHAARTPFIHAGKGRSDATVTPWQQ